MLVAISPAASGAQEGSEVEAAAIADARVDEAIRKAVAFLVSRQRPDGAIAMADHNRTAMTAISIMALSAVGHSMTDPTPEGEALRKALDHVLNPERQEKNGYFGARDGSRMYGHGMISLMLAEMIGMAPSEELDRRIRDRLDPALQLILRAQNAKRPDNVDHFGGWRYGHDAGDSDLSVTIWQLMTLRAAKNAGLDVPSSAIEHAVGYLKRCFKKPGQGGRRKKGSEEDGACSYQPGHRPSYASAAAGLMALQLCGQYDSLEVTESAEWLRDYNADYGREYFFYGTYYFAQGMYQRGGDLALEARRRVENLLLPKQNPEGWWEAQSGQEREAGKVYATAMAILSLAVRYHYLPIYQR